MSLRDTGLHRRVQRLGSSGSATVNVDALRHATELARSSRESFCPHCFERISIQPEHRGLELACPYCHCAFIFSERYGDALSRPQVLANDQSAIAADAARQAPDPPITAFEPVMPSLRSTRFQQPRYRSRRRTRGTSTDVPAVLNYFFKLSLSMGRSRSSRAAASVFARLFEMFMPTIWRHSYFGQMQRASQLEAAIAKRAAINRQRTAFHEAEVRERTVMPPADIANLPFQKSATEILVYPWQVASGIQFESFLARVFSNLGATVYVTSTTGDQGVDLIVTIANLRIAVQAKGGGLPITNTAVQEVVAGMHYYGCNGCAVVTNSSFTRGAIDLAVRCNCLLIDGEGIYGLAMGRNPWFLPQLT